jgi:hypothetical protein
MLLDLPKIFFLVKASPVIETDVDVNQVLRVAIGVMAV